MQKGTAGEIRKAKRRSAHAGNGYGFRIIRQKYPTPHEAAIIDMLRKNKASFEFQPVVFCVPLQRQISPDFLVSSWRQRKLSTPVYIEIDGNSKNLSSAYQIKRIEGLKYPLLRIWNKDIQTAEQVLDRILRAFL